MIHDKIVKRRSIRKYNSKPIPKEILVKCVNAARLSPSGTNLQPLKYIIIHEEQLVKNVFPLTRWAFHLPQYYPSIEERPRAYIAVLIDNNIRKDPGHSGHDVGIAAMSISMVAYDEGLGSCMLGAIDRVKLKGMLNVPNHLDIVLLVALGYSTDKPVIDEVKVGDIKYWLDDDGVIHVPKRSLEEVLRWNTYQ